jgi:glycosyltransferase involved in cell wall biosynthesis
MRSLHIDEQTGWRGGELQASWLMRGLAARGHWVGLAAREGSPFLSHDFSGAAVEKFAVPLRSEVDLLSARHLARIAREHRVDILHAHTSHAHTLACMARWFYPVCKVVAHRRVSFPPRAGLLNRWKYRAPDRIVCVSGEVRRVLLDYGLPPEQAVLVHSAVNLERLNVSPTPREALGVPEGVPLLVNAGALVGHKDQATLIDAMAVIGASVPEARLLILGEGPLYDELEAHIMRLGLQDRVRLLGHRTDAPAVIRAADVYISSSWSEGLGTSVLEGLACGIPVVAAIAGGIPEMVIDGETGWLTPNRDPLALAAAVLDALARPDEAHRRASAGRHLVEDRFTVERMIEGNLAVYRSLLTG